jgi:hypothetical protein
MRVDFEERILRNPALGATLLWQFSRSYVDHRDDGHAPNLSFLLLPLPMLLHGPTMQKIKGMRFESGLLKAVIDQPEIMHGLQHRVERMASTSLSSLSLACAAQLLIREEGYGFPSFRPHNAKLPPALRSTAAIVGDMTNAARRIGAWFAHDGLQAVCFRLGIRF